MDSLQCLDELKRIRSAAGYSTFFSCVKKLSRERLQVEGREKRVKFPPRMYQKLYDDQDGLCPECQLRLHIPARKNEIDHKDPNRTDFNHPSNLQLLHGFCNREKSSSSMLTQAKRRGKTMKELIL